MKRPNPEMIDSENPEWTDEEFAKAVPLDGLPADLQDLLVPNKRERKDPAPRSSRKPAA